MRAARAPALRGRLPRGGRCSCAAADLLPLVVRRRWSSSSRRCSAGAPALSSRSMLQTFGLGMFTALSPGAPWLFLGSRAGAGRRVACAACPTAAEGAARARPRPHRRRPRAHAVAASHGSTRSRRATSSPACTARPRRVTAGPAADALLRPSRRDLCARPVHSRVRRSLRSSCGSANTVLSSDRLDLLHVGEAGRGQPVQHPGDQFLGHRGATGDADRGARRPARLVQHGRVVHQVRGLGPGVGGDLDQPHGVGGIRRADDDDQVGLGGDLLHRGLTVLGRVADVVARRVDQQREPLAQPPTVSVVSSTDSVVWDSQATLAGSRTCTRDCRPGRRPGGCASGASPVVPTTSSWPSWPISRMS